MENMQKLLLRLISSCDFQKLSGYEKKFNIFSPLSIYNKGTLLFSSKFLCRLLNSKESHKLGEMFFKELLKYVVKIDNKYRPLLYADTSDLEVEYKEYFVMESKKSKMLLVIENEYVSAGYEQAYVKRRMPEKYKDYTCIFIYLTPERVHKNNMRYREYIRINYGIICNIIDEILKEESDIDDKIRFFLTHYKEVVQEYIMGNIDYDMAALCRKIYLEHKEAIENIYVIQKKECDIKSFVSHQLEYILQGSKLFETIDKLFSYSFHKWFLCLPCGIDDAVKEKLLVANKNGSARIPSYAYMFYFSCFRYQKDSVYFGVKGYPEWEKKYMARKDGFRKSLENELDIKIDIEKDNEIYLIKDEPLFNLDILHENNIVKAMKNRFEEKCVPYIEKFVAAINKADVV